ncbi:MAG: 23S rRNA (adenine(2503)-C(2))-methyltransferase RlmN [Sphaerochaetaceae bacterium]|jgi:23S rRNA (adenine2503-C2)-methyltransferase
MDENQQNIAEESESKRRLPLSLYGLSPRDIQEALDLDRQYQGNQIWEWLVKGATNFEQMSNLSKAERERLSKLMPSFMSSAIISTQTDETGATKLAIKLFDGQVVECVLLKDKDGRGTACLSCQVGCAMGCTFCRTGTMGLVRNLAAEEIIEQFIHLRSLGDDITHIVFMGMGEPMANLGPVVKSIRYFHDPAGLDIGLRRITISTCGVAPGILKLAEQKLGVRLAVSLVTADNDQRDLLMPANKAWPLEELRKALIRYQRIIGKRFTFEYCMIHGINTDEASAKKLAKYIRDMDVMVNLIPWNPAAELPWETPTMQEINEFTTMLDHMRIPYTRRFSRGRGINGACGQLAVPLNNVGTDNDTPAMA